MPTTPAVLEVLKARLTELDAERKGILALIGSSGAPTASKHPKRGWTAAQKAATSRRMKALWKARKAKG